MKLQYALLCKNVENRNGPSFLDVFDKSNFKTVPEPFKFWIVMYWDYLATETAKFSYSIRIGDRVVCRQTTDLTNVHSPARAGDYLYQLSEREAIGTDFGTEKRIRCFQMDHLQVVFPEFGFYVFDFSTSNGLLPYHIFLEIMPRG